jgi:glycogen debranching enzyme
MSNEKPVELLPASGAAPPEPFYIPAREPATRPRRTMKHGDCFVMVDTHGDIGAADGGPDGLFFLDTRYLSHFEMLINGVRPLLLGSNLADNNAVFSVDLANSDIYYGNRVILRKSLLHIDRRVFLSADTLFHRFAIHNFASYRVRLLLSLTYDCDFADIFEVRGTERLQRGSVRPRIDADRVQFAYHGLDDKIRRTTIAFEPTPTHLSASLASFRLDLEPGKARSVFAAASCNGTNPQRPSFMSALRNVHRDLKSARQGCARIETSNDVFNEILERAAADLAMLVTPTPHGPYPYAGIPWYSTTFGRDGLITALQCLWLDPRLALGVLRRLAAFQAGETDPQADAEPGKILHEMRAGEMSALGEVPFGLYYGSVDSTPLFVILAGQYAQATGDVVSLRELWPAVERALAWIDGPADPDGDGFVEYFKATPRGLANQGWKDSHDAVSHADGQLATGPIAIAEVQGYVYAAKALAAWCADKLGDAERARTLAAAAEELARRFEATFWCEEIGTYALALDGDKRPCRIATSNAGQVLFSGIAGSDHASAVARHLMAPKLFSGWGVRTLSASERRYNPMSYHNGSIWPHDNALIALGLARYGDKASVARIFQALFDAATYMDLRRLPELFCGFTRVRGRGPTLYPVACAPQAWASAAFYALIEACLGIEQDPWAGEIRFRNPVLPPFLDKIVLRELRVGEASVDVSIRRHRDGKLSLQTLASRGDVQVTAIFRG